MPATTLRSSAREASRLRAMVDENLTFVTRTLRRAGVPVSELDDQVQQTFIVVATRIADVQPGSERPFLYQVALNTAAHLRRKLARRREVMDDRVPERVEALATPEHLTSRKEIRRLIDQVARHMNASLYEVFKLSALEGVNLKEIAKRLGLRRGTVASRLRRARAEFRKHATEIDLAWDMGNDETRMVEPRVMSRDKLSKLMRALLSAGASPGASDATRLETLAVLGFATRTAETAVRRDRGVVIR